MLKTFWMNNQKFLLVCGGVLLVFLMINSFLAGLVEGAEKTYVECRKLQKKIDLLHKDLKRTYWSERNNLSALETREGGLAKEISLPPEQTFKDKKALLVQFNKRVTKIWASVQGPADARGLVLPKKLTGRDFNIEQEDSAAEYAIYHSYLDVVERALEALVASGMTRIGSPDPIEQFSEAVALEEENVGLCWYRPVSFQVTGGYESYIRLFESMQEPEKFLQVRLTSPLQPARRGEKNSLRAELEFIGLQMKEIEEESILDGASESLEGRRR